ncbi:hypothetical protein POM88_015528 [Heracleum sosnowskyi]|uniref:F-box domain-containing protein n=1 Tax=Heracleum sosnowskyi TaxID=360622 RepID=A0AAD8IKF5_9APIA|nr:hypothetical protein POM88_015528 [Heracleum sosnowskyi]
MVEVYSASADMIGGSEDLIDKILLCLPVRSLVRFKSVSKQWNLFISNPGFGLAHTLKNTSSGIPIGLFLYYTDILNKRSTVNSVPLGGKIPSFDDSMEIVQCCNGLNLFRIEQRYCVCNLATNQLESVPLPELYPSTARFGAWFLAFDPSISSHYKIVCMQEVENRTNRFLIFSSETSRWKDANVRTNYVNISLWESAKGVYFKGAIYCLVFNYCHDGVFYRFDVEAGKLTGISLPPSYNDYNASHFGYFGEFNGHLHLVCDRDGFAERFNVFELDHVNDKWFVKYKVHFECSMFWFPEVVVQEVLRYAYSIVSVVSGEKEEDSALIMTIPGKVVCYNIRSKKIEVLHELPPETLSEYGHVHFTLTFPFIPTLFPL